MRVFGWTCTSVGIILLIAGGILWLDDSIMNAATTWFHEIANRELRAV